MANESSVIFLGETTSSGTDYATIPNGLPIKVMRHLIETTETLSTEGDIYIGTGSYHTVSFNGEAYGYYETKGLHDIVPYDASDSTLFLHQTTTEPYVAYSPLSRNDFTANAFNDTLTLSDSVQLTSDNFANTITLDQTQLDSTTTWPLTSTIPVSSTYWNKTIRIPIEPERIFCLLLLSGTTYTQFGLQYSPAISDYSSIAPTYGSSYVVINNSLYLSLYGSSSAIVFYFN